MRIGIIGGTGPRTTRGLGDHGRRGRSSGGRHGAREPVPSAAAKAALAALPGLRPVDLV
ncbi:hypothetical protein GQF56_20095 [Rhodobacter sphaeroides]|jgi:hypothetical protein|uniref:Uncharacterized protein n=1 Tax=Cereibacter sphaeroides (strain ATCC 17023 / DSM 158 / JCM 6121 / CCUG 31486 / LMG 2827 / NBRC 12203 / NCIMB 8253 / ATH 2.4.1.) TaxID=272943 RepID=U5NRQ3_CERS4|nr:hypothetical protein [Cereibacter sphaeroides]AGY32485.1 hypothetical protein RSP_7646 [Cereibacter sphaeroides 2.4.1]AXC63904.1 hypothetical protein DQL45_21150 [Cereibacter sphaeroides 2.4.1]MVX50146.1 hypothetical protein [Cereibacter sphaeroides]QHA12151.1 hypothetical protein GQR99_21250 [Cereibacter sphaeroides]QHA15400.1 hypothetical protein GQY06_21185 [Cereibacter sphaeroides]